MSQKIITISREYGSGGRLIGQRVAQKLGVAFYDKELIRMAARESGYSLDFIEENEELSSGSFLYSLATGGAYPFQNYTGDHMSPQDKLYILQNKVIKDIAQRGPCVIVGRCADYILKEWKDSVHIFIHGSKESKLKRVIDEYGIDPSDAEKEIRRKDKRRAAHYKHYTDREWGQAGYYHMTLDSGFFGVERCAEIIIQTVKI